MSREPHFELSDDGRTLTMQSSKDISQPLVDQEGYEERLKQEADMMVSLETIRVMINKLDDDME